MKQSTSFAQVATNLLNVLQGYTKGIQFLLVMFLTLTVSAEVWGADVTVKWTASSGALGSKIGSGTIKTGTFSWDYTRTLKSGETYTGWTSNCIQLGKNGGVENITFTTSAIPGTIKSVSVECSSYNNAHKVSIKVGNNTYLSSTATAKWTTISTKTGSGTSSGQIVISFTDGSRALYIKSISVTYEEAAATVPVTGVSLDKSTLILTEGDSETLTATVAPANATDKTVTWSTSDANIATVSNGKVTAVAEGSATITVKTKDGNKTATCNVTVNPKPKYTVTLVPGSGSVPSTTLTESSAGAGVELPTLELDCGDWKFAGWAISPVEEEITEVPNFITDKPYKPSGDVTLYAVYQRTETTEGVETTTTTTDKLTRETTGITKNSTSYSNWSGKTANSSAVYAGNSAGGNDAIQLRSNNSNSGVITTASGGKAKKVTVVWQSSTASGRTLDIYGKNSAYSAATDLYSTSTQGTRLGSIVNGTSTELTITGDYEYIGLRSNSGAMYLTSISIDWATTTNGGASTTTYYHSTPTCTTKTSVTLNPNGGTFTSTPDGWTKEGNNYTKEVEGSITLPTPIHDGCYDFAGWYDEQTDGNKIGDEYEPEEDIELFAHWTESTTSFRAMIDDENIPTVEGFAIEIGLNEDETNKVTDGIETTCGNNVFLFRTLVQGYKEVQWTVTIAGKQETIAVQNDGDVPYFVMPKANVLVSAELIECDEMDAPDVTATSTNNSITLSWGPIIGAKEYNVFIFYDYGNSHQQDAAALVENETSYTFTNLDAEHTYTYIVQAQTEIGTCFTETMGKITTASATCKVTYNANGGEGTITDDTEYTNGANVTVKGNFGNFTKDGYAFTGWNTMADGSGTSYKAGDQFTITANTTLYAQWCEAYWKLVTDESELENDTRIVIAAKDENYALSTNQKTNNRGQAEIIKKYNTITFGADVQTLSLVGLQDNKFALYTGSGYLYAAGSEKNYYLKTGTSDGNDDWSIGISVDGTAIILAQGINTNNQLKYNTGSDLFSCYGSTNSQKDVVIYKEVCKQDLYEISENLSNATAANTNAKTVLASATSLSLKYSAADGYLLPETITVQMGGATLASGTDYTWNKETGVLTITVTGFYGDIDVKIVAEKDPCYGFAMSAVNATSTTTSITLTWTAVDGATGYNVKIGTGEFTAANGLTHTFEGLSPKTTYTWEVQAVKGNLCQASKTGTTTTQKESFTVSWVVNGNTTATESVVDGNSITQYPSVPSAPSGCSEKVFVGWTNNSINTPTDEAPAILYKQKSDVPAITVNTTLHAVWADEKTTEGEEVEVEKIASVNISDYASVNNWNNGTQYTTVNIDKNITATAATTGANTGKYYTSGNTWRFYRSDNGILTINAAEGCTIKTIKITYTVDDSGVLTYNSSNKESNSEISINASSANFGVGNTNSATNGKVFVTAISVTYTTKAKGPDVITHSAYTTLCDECTPSESLVLAANASTADLDINGKATITFSTTGGNGGAITYAANPKTGVTWDNGTATFTKAGDYTITASQGKNGEYCPTTSNTVNVTITAIPHLYFVTDPAPTTIEFDPVECGGNTRVEDKKSVSVQAYNLAAAVTAQVTGPYKIARTSGATLNEYSTILTLDKNEYDGHINGYYDDIYILSFPPAGSSEPTEGTLTFKTTNGNTLTVNLSTPTITCTPRTLTFNDRGIKTTQEYYAGTEVPEPTTPIGVCGEYEFDGWALAKVESGSTTYAKVKFPYIMPANNQTVLHAVYRYTEGPINQYELVTEIESGKDYVIAAYDKPNGDFALTNSESSTNGKFASVKVECDVNNIITTDNANIIWTVTGNDEDGYKFYNSAVQKYIEMYRYDGKSLLRLVDNCVNPFYVNIEKDLNNDVTVDITSPEVDENYNVFSFYQELFNVYTRCDYNIYFYEQTATPLYTTTPDCHPSVTLISDGEVYVTATNGRGIMAATPLTLTTTDLAPNTEIAISSNSNDIYFSTERNTNFAMAQASQPKTSLTLPTNEGGELETQLYIHYKPSADGDGTPAEVVVTADVSTHNPPFTAQKTIHVRNLPAKFVIATKAGATWYALPANMNGATNPAAVVIEVDETTMTATAPNTTPYTLWPVATINGGTDRYKEYGERLRFAAVNNGNKGLWANNADKGTTINNNGAIVARGDTPGAAYEWKVTTTVVDGLWQYTLQTDQTNNQKNLCYRMNQENPAWGTYASNEAQYQLYFLPIKAETTPFDYQVVEWYPNKVLIHTTTAFSSLTAKIAGGQVANVQYTAKDANQYEITGLPLMENPAKALTLEFVVADATHTGIHTIPVMLSGGDHSVSTLAIGKGIYNYNDLVVRDGATLTVDGAANTDNTFYDVTIYPTAKISVPEGKQLSVHSLTFFGGIDEIYNGSTYELNKYGVPQLSLKGTLGKTVTTMDYIMRVNLDQMYSLGVPYDVALADIEYWDGSAIGLGTQLYVSAYDGQARANREKQTWIYETDFETKLGSATLKAGVGYTISAEPQAEDTYSILRMPMKNNINSGATEGEKKVNVVAYDNQKGVTITDNHKGWNLLSNPYMTAISGGEADTKLVLGYLKETGTGPWEWVETTQRYVTIPSDDGTYYWQQKFTDAVLPPFKNFFVQVGTTGELVFDLGTRQSMPARSTQTAIEKEVEFEILMTNDARQDNTGLLISEEYSPAYEINADLEKMTGSMSVYTIYGGYKLAYNALSPINASEWIPMGYIAPTAGEYTFRLDDIDKIVEQVEHVYLIDYEANNIVDLMDDEYEFTTDKEQNNNRFAINIVLIQDKDNTTTGMDIINGNVAALIKFIYHDKMYIQSGGVIYDGTGKQVTNINK